MGRGVSCEVTLSFSLREAMDRPWEQRSAGGHGSCGLGSGQPTVAEGVQSLHKSSSPVRRRTPWGPPRSCRSCGDPLVTGGVLAASRFTPGPDDARECRARRHGPLVHERRDRVISPRPRIGVREDPVWHTIAQAQDGQWAPAVPSILPPVYSPIP
ncbi:hypothetical protein GCM10009590_03770 [Brachybacterium alimentarium]